MISFQEHPDKADLHPLTLLRREEDLFCGLFSVKERWDLGLQAIRLEETIELPALTIPLHTLWHNNIPNSKDEHFLDSRHYLHVSRNHDFIRFNQQLICSDLELFKKMGRFIPVPDHVQITGPKEQIFIEEGATLEHVFLNTTSGPIYIGRQTLIMDGACLRGPIAIREHSVIKMGATLYPGTSIGRHCVIGGEVKNSIVYDYSNKAHDGYLGDSIIGSWCNLGAGTTCSNLKNTGKEINTWNVNRKMYEPSGIKAGVVMGDFTRTAINCSINSGTVIGVCTNLVPNALPLPTFVPSFTWFQERLEKYQLDKALEHIRKWMEFKDCFLTLELAEQLTAIYNTKEV